MNIITRASVKERIHVEQIIRSQPHMHNSGLVDIVTIPVRKCLGLSMDVYKPVGEVKEPLKSTVPSKKAAITGKQWMECR